MKTHVTRVRCGCPPVVNAPRCIARLLVTAAALLLVVHVSPRATPQDGSPPVAKGYSLVKPGAAATNGHLVEFYAFWDSAHYAVSADLSGLDDTAHEPVPGTYVSDTTVVLTPETSEVWAQYWFSYRVSPENGRADAARIPVPVTAINGTSNDTTVMDAIEFCLSNHPPVHVRTEVIGDAERFIVRGNDTLYVARNGEALHIETAWRFGTRPFMVTADFSAVDDSFATRTVDYWLAGSSGSDTETHAILYTLDEQAKPGSAYPLPVHISAADGACGRDSVTVLIELDNEGPEGAARLDSLPAENSTPEILVSGTVPAGSADGLVVLNHSTEYAFDAVPAGDSLIFAGTVSLAPGTNHLVAYGRDWLGNRSDPSAEQYVALQSVPLLKRIDLFSPEPDTIWADSAETYTEQVVRNGESIHFHTYWDDRQSYDLSADFSALDSEAGIVWGVPIENQEVTVGDTTETWYGYRFEHTVSPLNEIADDDGHAVPVTAYDPTTGYSTTSELLRFCLSNRPPEHLWTKILGDSSHYVVRDESLLYLVRNGSKLTVQTSWFTLSRPLALLPDLSAADQFFDPQRVDSWIVDSLNADSIATYGFSWTFSQQAWDPESEETPYPLPVYVRVKDRGCGWGQSTLLLEMDNEGPEESPWFDPQPPDQVAEAELEVSGSAQGDAHDLVLVVTYPGGDSSMVVATLGEQRTFRETVSLEVGVNQLVAYGRDLLGNRSSPSTRYDIARIAGTSLDIPKPFYAGDAFSLQSKAGFARVEAEIYNLEGDRIHTWDVTGDPVRLLVELTWDGRNRNGERVRRGPYLFRARTTGADGRTGEEVKAFVYAHQ